MGKNRLPPPLAWRQVDRRWVGRVVVVVVVVVAGGVLVVCWWAAGGLGFKNLVSLYICKLIKLELTYQPVDY